MGRDTSRNEEPCGFSLLPENVIPFPRYSSLRPPKIFCISNCEKFEDKFVQCLPDLQVKFTLSLDSLRNEMLNGIPDLILIQSSLEWANPIELIAKLSALTDAPILLLLDGKKSPQMQQLVKRAYTVGIHDVIRTPHDPEEWREAIHVLLKSRLLA